MEASAAVQPGDRRQAAEARLEVRLWPPRNLVKVEGRQLEEIDQMKPLAGYVLTGTVCLRNSVRQLQDKSGKLPDRFPSIQPRSFRHTSRTSGEVRPRESFDQTVRVG